MLTPSLCYINYTAYVQKLAKRSGIANTVAIIAYGHSRYMAITVSFTL